MAYPDKDLAAGGTIEGSYTPLPLFAGDAPVVTEEGVVTLPDGVVAKHTVLGRETGTGLLVGLGQPTIVGGDVAVGILTQSVNTTDADVPVAYYTAGFFNHEALVWPATHDTLEKRKAAFAGTAIHIGSVRL